MILDNDVIVAAPPDTVFALLGDPERVVKCLPGATFEGSDGDTHRGQVKVKVGPITAAYAGTVRFLDIDSAQRRMRMQALGTDMHGSGDAEAEVVVTVEEAPEGTRLRLNTDLVIRGKIVQFGKSAIAAVSAKLLDQFAGNLAALLDAERAGAGTGPSAAAAPQRVPALASAASDGELDGLSLLLGPAAKYAPLAAAFAVGLFQGWLLGKLAGQSRLLKEMRRG